MSKFKRGNIVEILKGHVIWTSDGGKKEIDKEQIGKKAVIDGSYADLYGGSNTKDYSIILLDTGSSLAWKNEEELEYIEEGGEYLFKECEDKRKELEQKYCSKEYILEALESGNISSSSILYLFNLLGFDSSFKSNGQYFCLFHDWSRLEPVFIYIKKADTIEEAKKALMNPDDFSIEKVWGFLHN